MEINDIVHFA